ncbi:MAG: universal stress protein [Crocinitomicaceae bacterium]|nr:universal stress protein [Crocinitomicaceae bacterium]
MYKVILTTNFSESARNAMCYAVQLFGATETEYYIMNTFIDSPTGNDGFLSASDLASRGYQKELKADETYLRKVFPDKDLIIHTRSVYGNLTSAINELVHNIGANYVVIGNKKQYDFDSGILRAKTYEFVRNIECPVLAIPAEREFKVDEGGLIFASDLHTIKKPDHLEPLVRIAKQHKVPVMTIHIKKPAHETTEEETKGSTQLSMIFDIVDYEMHQLEREDVLTGISEFVESHGNSLLVLLARKHNFFKRLTQQSLTKEMSKLANMPLLILHDY